MSLAAEYISLRNTKPLIHYTFPGIPIPAPRPRSGRHGVYNPSHYTVYKRALAEAIRSAYPDVVASVPSEREKCRTKWLATNRYHLVVTVYRAKRTGDWDNYAKTVCDALQDAGVIGNDNQIDAGGVILITDKADPRIEIWLNRIEVRA